MIPGSALRRLSALTGLEATKESEGCYRLSIVPDVAYFALVKDEKEACKILERDNWNRVSYIVFEYQGWKCAKCGSMTELSCHHKIFRSRWRPSDGPRDVPEALVGLCIACHQKEHGIGK